MYPPPRLAHRPTLTPPSWPNASTSTWVRRVVEESHEQEDAGVGEDEDEEEEEEVDPPTPRAPTSIYSFRVILCHHLPREEEEGEQHAAKGGE